MAVVARFSSGADLSAAKLQGSGVAGLQGLQIKIDIR
jgi:hypothetical protein